MSQESVFKFGSIKLLLLPVRKYHRLLRLRCVPAKRLIE